jgi:hypothetical protein
VGVTQAVFAMGLKMMTVFGFQRFAGKRWKPKTELSVA